MRRQFYFIAYNVLQLNADFVLHKICDLGAVIRCLFYEFNLKNKNMTPKEKANQLYANMLNSDIMNMTNYCAKQCALIAVDEILGQFRWKPSEGLSYWEQVKLELQSL